MKYCISIIAWFISTAGTAQGWHELGAGACALKANASITSVVADTGGVLYATGGFTDSLYDTAGKGYVAKWDGECWSKLGVNDTFSNGAGALCIDAHHRLYAAGCLFDTDGKKYVAVWNGTAWSELGTGSNALNANDCIYSLCTDASGNIYAAGAFTDAAGYCYIAKWDGSSWQELGAGSAIGFSTFASIWSICSDGLGNIYAAGDFEDSGYYYVAKWDGASWTRLGTGSNDLFANFPISTIAADGLGNIYAGGFFTDPAGYTYIAKWNGVNWSELGTGSNALKSLSQVYSLITDNKGNVFAADIAYVHDSVNIARWDGTTWSQLGIGAYSLNANQAIWSICRDSAGNIYAGGAFTDSVSSEKGYYYVAKYDMSKAETKPISQYQEKIKIYPNPAVNTITVQVNTDDFSTMSGYRIYSDVGVVVCQGQLRGEKTEINIMNLPIGIYLLRLADYPNNNYKIIKN